MFCDFFDIKFNDFLPRYNEDKSLITDLTNKNIKQLSENFTD